MVHGIGAAALLLNCVSRSIVTVLLLTLFVFFYFFGFHHGRRLETKIVIDFIVLPCSHLCLPLSCKPAYWYLLLPESSRFIAVSMRLFFFFHNR